MLDTPGERDQVLEVRDIDKGFRSVKAVRRLSFDVRKGQIFALLGPNGAGKTTMVRMLMGIIRPDAGRISWRLGSNGGWPDRSLIGYLAEERGLYKDVPILRSLVYFGVLRGLSRKAAEQASLLWLERLGLKERGKEKLEALSKGNQQKIQFIASVLHRPQFAVLDEPFSGLDPINQDAFLQMLRELRDEGMTILLSAHQMELIERLADRILLINRGEAVLEGSWDEIRSQANAGSKLLLRIGGEPDLGRWNSHPAVVSAESDEPGNLSLWIKSGHSLNDLLVQLGSSLEILSIHSERLSLHDVYVRTIRQIDGSEDPSPVSEAIS